MISKTWRGRKEGRRKKKEEGGRRRKEAPPHARQADILIHIIFLFTKRDPVPVLRGAAGCVAGGGSRGNLGQAGSEGACVSCGGGGTVY